MSGKDGSGKIAKSEGSAAEKSVDSKKARAQPGDFERQVEQIRKDIDSVRSNLQEAEKALDKTERMNSTTGVTANEGVEGPAPEQ